MIIDAYEIFAAQKAYNGDLDEACKLLKIYTEQKDWDKCGEFSLLLVDHEPEFCEQKLLEYIGEPIRYEDMLGIIALSWQSYRNEEMVYKWVQKYSDFVNIKYAHLTIAERESMKMKFPLYNMFKERGELDNIEHRFLLKWEQKRYLSHQINAS